MTEATATARLRVVADTDAARSPGGSPEGRCPPTAGDFDDVRGVSFHPAQNPDPERGSHAPEKNPEKNPEKKSRGGRPKGSKNRVTADARALLAGPKGLKALDTFLRFAAGQPIFRQLRGGSRERIDPTPDQMLQAGRALLPCLVPQLKSSEVDTTIRHVDDTPTDPRQLARGILHALSQGVAPDDGDAGHEVRHVSNPVGVFVPNEIDDEESDGFQRLPSVSKARSGGSQGRSAAPEIESADLEASLGSGGRRTGSVATRKATESDAEIGERELVGDNGGFIELRRVESTGRELWGIFDSAGTGFGSAWSREEARAKAEALAADRRI